MAWDKPRHMPTDEQWSPYLVLADAVLSGRRADAYELMQHIFSQSMMHAPMPVLPIYGPELKQLYKFCRRVWGRIRNGRMLIVKVSSSVHDYVERELVEPVWTRHAVTERGEALQNATMNELLALEEHSRTELELAEIHDEIDRRADRLSRLPGE